MDIRLDQRGGSDLNVYALRASALQSEPALSRVTRH